MDNSQIMTEEEILERNCSIDETGKVIDENGNEYRNENGCCCYVEKL